MISHAKAAPAASGAGDGSYFKSLGAWWALFLAVLIFGVALRIWLFLTSDFTVGDAFITFRFAEQFAAGHGLVFNTGESVGGNTSLLHSLLLGLGACTGLGVPLVARIEGTLFDKSPSFFFMRNVFRAATAPPVPPVSGGSPWHIVFLCPFRVLVFRQRPGNTPVSDAHLFPAGPHPARVNWLWYLAITLLFFCRPGWCHHRPGGRG